MKNDMSIPTPEEVKMAEDVITPVLWKTDSFGRMRDRLAQALHTYGQSQYEKGKKESDQLQAIFDLQWKRMTEWEAEWHKAFPDKELTKPDFMELLNWKLEQARQAGMVEGAEKVVRAILAARSELNKRCSACRVWPNGCDNHHDHGGYMETAQSVLNEIKNK